MRKVSYKSIITLLLSIISTISSAQVFVVDGIRYHVTSDSTCEVIKANNNNSYIVYPSNDPYDQSYGTSTSEDYGSSETEVDTYSGDITIPSTVEYNDNKYTVTAIANEAFAGYCTIKMSLSLPNTITSIGKGAFCQRYMDKIVLPDNIESIPEYAFYMSAVESITLPQNLKSIEKYAFMECMVSSITFPNGLQSIGESAFEACGNLTSIDIPIGVSIGDHPFKDCAQLNTITVGGNNDGNAIIDGGRLIQGCRNTVISESVSTIAPYAFSHVVIMSLVIPSNVNCIEDYGFNGCVFPSIVNYAEEPQMLSDNTFGSDGTAMYNILHVLPGCKAKYEQASVWKNFTIIEDAVVSYPEITYPEIKLNDKGYSTFSFNYDAQLSSDEVKAYTAVVKDNKIICNEVPDGIIPSGNGVLLYGKANATAHFSSATSVQPLSNNDLIATTQSDGSLKDIPNSGYNYVLSGSMFGLYTGSTFTAGKAYFNLSNKPTASSNSKMSIVFNNYDEDEGEATGIETIENVSSKVVYDLQGRQVKNPSNGVYIVNKKKVVIK